MTKLLILTVVLINAGCAQGYLYPDAAGAKERAEAIEFCLKQNQDYAACMKEKGWRP